MQFVAYELVCMEYDCEQAAAYVYIGDSERQDVWQCAEHRDFFVGRYGAPISPKEFVPIRDAYPISHLGEL